ncbi:MAG: ArsR/SmtB family transcription factor [Lachnospiraceae bacterium]
MGQSIQLNLDDGKKLAALGKALSSEVRIELLRLLHHCSLNVNEIAERLGLPPSSAAMHVKVLEEAGLIRTELLPAVRGSMKVCHKAVEEIELFLGTAIGTEQAEVINMPIGSYVDYQVAPTCGLVSEKGPIGEEDEPRCFYHPDRSSASLLWFGCGYVEYRFPNHMLKTAKETKLELSMELCSEDHEYNFDCPSDITVWVNGVEAGTWCCPSDFGGRRGIWNPEWWPDKNTQYGLLKTWKITEDGTYIDNEKVSDVPLEEFRLNEKDYISVRIGIKETAKHKGGVNLFGEGFGDYAQGIRMAVYYETEL